MDAEVLQTAHARADKSRALVQRSWNARRRSWVLLMDTQAVLEACARTRKHLRVPRRPA